jgi:hypothetical protein
MSVTLICPNLNCKAVLQVPDTTRGKKVRFGHCGGTFVVPQKKTAEAANPAASAEPDATPTEE